MAKHDPNARAAASATRRPRLPEIPVDAAAGTPDYDPETQKTIWVPVRGPHLRTVRQRFARNTTGCPGISRATCRLRRPGGGWNVREYFVVNLGQTCRKFGITTLGEAEAWRKALRCRADHELRIRAINQTILTKRQAAACTNTNN